MIEKEMYRVRCYVDHAEEWVDVPGSCGVLAYANGWLNCLEMVHSESIRLGHIMYVVVVLPRYTCME